MAHRVDAEVERLVLKSAYVVEIDRQWRLGIDVLQIPLEILTAEVFPQLEAVGDVACLDCVEIRDRPVKVLDIVVGPDVDQAAVVAENDLVGASWEGVRCLLAKHVSNM